MILRFLLAFLLISTGLSAQPPGTLQTVTGNWKYFWFAADSAFKIPTDTATRANDGSIAIKNGNFYFKTGGVWTAFSGGITYSGGYGVKLVGSQFRFDSANVRKTDTIYAVTDSTFGYTINGKAYTFKFRGAVTGVAGRTGAVVIGVSDITGLTAVLNAKADQTALVDSAAAIRADIVGSTGVSRAELQDTAAAIRADFPAAGGNTNSNIGTGYRWAVPNTNNIKTVFPGYGISIDSATNALTVKLDTATAFAALRASIPGAITPTLDQVLTKDSVSGRSIFLKTKTTASLTTGHWFGDSESIPYNIADVNDGFVKIAGKRLGVSFTNHAVSGWSMQTMSFSTGSLEANLNMIPTRVSTDKFIGIALGINDLRYMNASYTAITFATVYRKIMDTLIARGWANKIVLVKPFYAQKKTYYNDSVGNGFSQAASQARNLIFGDTVQSIANSYPGTKVIDGNAALLYNGADSLIQADSLHMNEFGNIAIANVVTRALDTIKQGTQTLAVQGTTQTSDLIYNSPTISNGKNAVLGIDPWGHVGVVNNAAFNFLSVLNDANIKRLLTTGAIEINDYTPVPTTGASLHMSRFPSNAEAYFISPHNWGAGTPMRLHLGGYGGAVIAGSFGWQDNGSIFQTGVCYLGSTMFFEGQSPPSGNGFVVWRTGGQGYIYNTDGGAVNVGYNGSNVILAGSGDDGLHRTQIKTNAKFYGPVTVGPGQNSSLDVRLLLDSGTNLIAPIKFTPHNNKLTDPKDGVMEFDSIYFYLTAIGVRSPIATHAYIKAKTDTLRSVRIYNSGKSNFYDTVFNSKTVIDSADHRIVGDFNSYQSGRIITATGYNYSTGGIVPIGRNQTTGVYEQMPGVLPLAGSFSGAGTATTTFTVTIGTTMANTTYKVNASPTSALSAALFYITNKTTTTFDVVYMAGLTGTVTFDWSVFP